MYLPPFAGTFETWKGLSGAGGGKNKPDLLTGVLTPVQDQQLTRLWFGKTYKNSHTGAGQEAFNFAKWIRFLFSKLHVRANL